MFHSSVVPINQSITNSLFYCSDCGEQRTEGMRDKERRQRIISFSSLFRAHLALMRSSWKMEGLGLDSIIQHGGRRCSTAREEIFVEKSYGDEGTAL